MRNYLNDNKQEFPLKKGSKGICVERLQVWLMRNYGCTGIVTSEFDDNTEKVLMKVLRKKELDLATYKRMKMGRPVHEQLMVR